MRITETLFAVALAIGTAASASAQQPAVSVNGDSITLRGCVTKTGGQVPAQSMLVWSRGDILLAGAATASPAAPSPVGTAGIAGRVFYWLEDEDDLSKHIGQEVEVKGDLEDFEEGEVEIRRQGDFTEIELDFDGKEEKLRVPSAWLGGPDDDKEFKVIGRRIDVNDVKIIGACRN
jgi:hypothetical protein